MSSLRKIWNIVTSIIVIAVVIAAVLMAGVRLVGIQTYSVLSGSMEPSYHVGSLVYVKRTDAAELKTGDAITFMASEDVVATHRITQVLPDPGDPDVIRFVTKGDANDSEDAGTVHSSNVIGKVVFNIPYLGYAADFIQSPKGRYIAIAAGAFLLLLVFLPDLLFKEEETTEL